MTVEISNPLFHELKIKNGLPASDKPNLEHHGIGLKNVRRVCDTYDGELLWNDADGMSLSWTGCKKCQFVPEKRQFIPKSCKKHVFFYTDPRKHLMKG